MSQDKYDRAMKLGDMGQRIVEDLKEAGYMPAEVLVILCSAIADLSFRVQHREALDETVNDLTAIALHYLPSVQ